MREVTGQESGTSNAPRRFLSALIPVVALLLLITVVQGAVTGAEKAVAVTPTGDLELAPEADWTSNSEPDLHQSPVEFSDRRILVRFEPGTTTSERREARQAVDGTLLTAYEIVPRLQLVRIPADESMEDAREALEANEAIVYAVPDRITRLAVTPNDSRYADLWGMGAIKAPEAWDLGTGSQEVVVGVVDSGIDYEHPDLKQNIWTNPGEIPGNGIDDDGNGYIDDVHGWDFVNRDSDPADDLGHGTHVAGTIGAVGNNGLGVTGVNWQVKMMSLKICGSNNSCSYSAAIEALEYAIDQGAVATNNSWGGQHTPWSPFTAAVDAVRQAGQLFVAAAGNEGVDSDRIPFNPAGTPVDNVISVGATASSGELASFSNYGAETVDLMAPGQSIVSTLVNGQYGSKSGTSMAAPHVTGVAALLKSRNPGWNYSEIKQAILSNVTPACTYAGKAATTGSLNAGAAVTGTAPAARLCILRSGSGSGSLSAGGTALTCTSTVCQATLPASSVVSLNALPGETSTFAGWKGACQGSTPSCSVSGTQTKVATARFNLASPGPTGYSGSRLGPPFDHPEIDQSSTEGTTDFDLSSDGKVRIKGLSHIAGTNGTCYLETQNTGGVFVERLVDGAWQREAAIRTPHIGTDPRRRAGNCEGFGSYFALSGDGERLFVGIGVQSVGTDSTGTKRTQCAVYVYERAAGWSQTETLKPPGVGDNGVPATEAYLCRDFGRALAVDEQGRRIAVRTGVEGDSRGAIVFVERAGNWLLEGNLELPEGGCPGFSLEDSIALSGDGRHLILGNWQGPYLNSVPCNRAEYWTRDGNTWQHRQTIRKPEATASNYGEDFGKTVSMSADGRTLTISSRTSNLHTQGQGAVWVYERPGSIWQKRTRLSSPTPEKWAEFRCPAINANGSRIFCLSNETVGYNAKQGALYIFDAGSGWGSSSHPAARLADPEGEINDQLGSVGEGYASGSLVADHSGTSFLAPKSPGNVRKGLYGDMHLGMSWTALQPDDRPRLIGSVTQSAAPGESILVRGLALDEATNFRIGGITVEGPVVIGDSLVSLEVPQGVSSGEISIGVPGISGTRSAPEPITLDLAPSVAVNRPALTRASEDLPSRTGFNFGSANADTFVCRVDDYVWESCTSPMTAEGLEPGTHLFSVRAIEDGVSSLSSSLTFATSVMTPPAPELISAPSQWSNSTSATVTWNEGEGMLSSCSLDDANPTQCSTPLQLTGLSDGNHTLEITLIDQAGETSPPTSLSWVVDTLAPLAPAVSSGPSGSVSSTSASFAFTGEAGGSFECRIDSGAWGVCSSPKSYSGLSQGVRVFEVRQADQAGNVSEAGSRSWVVDTLAPDTPVVTDRPATVTNETSASFSFLSPEPGTFSCRLDDSEWFECESPTTFTDLDQGDHTFVVRHSDAVKNPSPAATETWTVDSIAPSPPSISYGSSGVSSSASASFSFMGEEGTSFECKVDDDLWAACSSPAAYSELSEDNHVFRVRARDTAGNISTASERVWVVDTLAPLAPAVSSGPSGSVSSTSASFAFTGEAGGSFECRIDSGAWGVCSSPKSYSGLSQGVRVFEVRQADQAGNVSEAGSRSWVVDTLAPLAPAISRKPPARSQSRTVVFAFAAKDAAGGYTCSLNSSRPKGCQTPFKATFNPSSKRHTFRVWARDAAGNSSAPSSWSFMILARRR